LLFTNTSEPISSDLSRHAERPVERDWLVRGVSGLRDAPTLYDSLRNRLPFGSYLVLPELEDLPFVETQAESFRRARRDLAGRASKAAMDALEAGESLLQKTGDQWSRALEEALYGAYGMTHPFA